MNPKGIASGAIQPIINGQKGLVTGVLGQMN